MVHHKLMNQELVNRLIGLSRQHVEFSIIGDELIDQDGDILGLRICRPSSPLFFGREMNGQALEMNRVDVYGALEEAREARRSRKFADLNQWGHIGAPVVSNYDLRARHARKWKKRYVEVANFNLPFEAATQHLQSTRVNPRTGENGRDASCDEHDYQSDACRNQPSRNGSPLFRGLFHASAPDLNV